MHNIIFDKEAINFLKKQEPIIKERIFVKLSQTKKYPFHYFQRLTGRKEYKLRIGNYRIIADIDDKFIAVHFIGHRKNIYKNL